MKNGPLLCCILMFIIGIIITMSGVKEHEEYTNTEKVQVTATVTDVEKDIERYKSKGKTKTRTVYYITHSWEYNGNYYSDTYKSSTYYGIGETSEVDIDVENPNRVLSDGESGIKVGFFMCFFSGVMAIIVIISKFMVKAKIRKESEECVN